MNGSSSTQTAPIASYKEEKLALIDGDSAMTRGTPLVIYGQNSQNTPFATTARTTDAYAGKYLGSGQGYLEGDKLFYRSIKSYRQFDPDRLTGTLQHSYENIFTTSLLEQMFTKPDGFRFSDQDADDALVLTATKIRTATNPNFGDSPIFAGDSGGGIFFRKPNGELRFISNISSKDSHPRLSSSWPWVVNTLLVYGLRQDAITLSQKVLGTGAWGSNDRKGNVGEIYTYDNPYTRKVEFFRLAALGADARYSNFPINQRDNDYWEYLGTTLPNIEQATTPLGNWGDNDRLGVVGDLYIYANPYSHKVEYFRLKALGGDGRYWYFPINQKDNEYWTYLGNDLPTRQLKFAARQTSTK